MSRTGCAVAVAVAVAVAAACAPPPPAARPAWAPLLPASARPAGALRAWGSCEDLHIGHDEVGDLLLVFRAAGADGAPGPLQLARHRAGGWTGPDPLSEDLAPAIDPELRLTGLLDLRGGRREAGRTGAEGALRWRLNRDGALLTQTLAGSPLGADGFGPGPAPPVAVTTWALGGGGEQLLVRAQAQPGPHAQVMRLGPGGWAPALGADAWAAHAGARTGAPLTALPDGDGGLILAGEGSHGMVISQLDQRGRLRPLPAPPAPAPLRAVAVGGPWSHALIAWAGPEGGGVAARERGRWSPLGSPELDGSRALALGRDADGAPLLARCVATGPGEPWRLTAARWTGAAWATLGPPEPPAEGPIAQDADPFGLSIDGLGRPTLRWTGLDGEVRSWTGPPAADAAAPAPALRLDPASGALRLIGEPGAPGSALPLPADGPFRRLELAQGGGRSCLAALRPVAAGLEVGIWCTP